MTTCDIVLATVIFLALVAQIRFNREVITNGRAQIEVNRNLISWAKSREKIERLRGGRER